MQAGRLSWIGVGLATLLLVTFAPPSEGAAWLDFRKQRSSLPEPHLVKGNRTNIEDFPFQVSIERYRVHYCGGVIISKNWAITAAHCIDPVLSGPIWGKRIRVGTSRQIPYIEWTGVVHEIEFSSHNPNFNLSKIDYDVGVLRVSKNFEFNERVRPVALPPVVKEQDQFIDFKQPGVASGWGRYDPNNWFPEVYLQRVFLPLIPKEECLRRYKNATWSDEFHPNITDRMICGGGDGKGGICGGDSGGPLLHKGYVIGLSSWNYVCNDPYYPAVFTSLLNKEVREFIRIHTDV